MKIEVNEIWKDIRNKFPKYVEEVLFECISAFGTVGFSLGITEFLSQQAKYIVILMMFIGRIGPLSFAFAFFSRKPKENFSYPEENVLIV